MEGAVSSAFWGHFRPFCVVFVSFKNSLGVPTGRHWQRTCSELAEEAELASPMANTFCRQRLRLSFS